MADPFGEQWFSTASQDVLARLADLDAKVVLELGTRTGVAPES